MCVSRQPRESQRSDAEGFTRRLHHTFVSNRRMRTDRLLIRATFLALEEKIDRVSTCDRFRS